MWHQGFLKPSHTVCFWGFGASGQDVLLTASGLAWGRDSNPGGFFQHFSFLVLSLLLKGGHFKISYSQPLSFLSILQTFLCVDFLHLLGFNFPSFAQLSFPSILNFSLLGKFVLNVVFTLSRSCHLLPLQLCSGPSMCLATPGFHYFGLAKISLPP